jgi:thioredoxin-related protein
MFLKKVTILPVIIILSFACTNDRDLIFKGAFSEALDYAKLNKKYLFIDFYTKWCGTCKGFDSFIKTHKLFQEYLNKSFVFLKVNAEEKEGIMLKNRYSVNGYPTFLVTDSKGNELGRIVGFNNKEEGTASLLITKINDFLKSKGIYNEITKLENEFKADTTNYKLLERIIKEYFIRKQYLKVKKYSSKLIELAENPATKTKAQYYYGMSTLLGDSNPSYLTNFVRNNPNLDLELKGKSSLRLLYFYKEKNDLVNTDYYYNQMIEIAPTKYYYKKEYARFLFENNFHIETANKLTLEYASVPEVQNDHFVPFLLAYYYFNKNQLEKGITEFDNWMAEYTVDWSIEDKYWPYVFYAKFALRNNVRLAIALEYAKEAENYRNSFEDKLLTGQILFSMERVNEATDKVNEALELADTENEYLQAKQLLAHFHENN